MGATRRLDHYELSTGWRPLFLVAFAGAIVIAIGIGFQVLQILVSIRDRKKNLDTTGDPWNGRTLEWSTASPPPFYNFALIPEVRTRDAFFAMKRAPKSQAKPNYERIHMPKSTSVGIYVGVFSFLFGFAAIWHILWLAIIGFFGIIASLIARLSNRSTETYVQIPEIEKIEGQRGMT